MISYTERAETCQSPIAKYLFRLLDEKKTNLALSADVTSSNQLLELADYLGPEICILKTHIDIIDDYTPQVTQTLRQLADKHRFYLFEDRKFADIGNTVRHQYQNGIYRIADWADLINAHALPGPGIISGLAEIGQNKNRGLFLIAEMSSAGNLMDLNYIQNTLSLADQFPDFVIGFITQRSLSVNVNWLNLTPGIKLEPGRDALGQQYATPEKAILKNGSDIIIVGRGILTANNPLLETKRYREQGWQAYLRRCKSKS